MVLFVNKLRFAFNLFFIMRYFCAFANMAVEALCVPIFILVSVRPLSVCPSVRTNVNIYFAISVRSGRI